MPVKAWALTKKWYTADFEETAASAGRQLAHSASAGSG
jgi:hypothetical protein